MTSVGHLKNLDSVLRDMRQPNLFGETANSANRLPTVLRGWSYEDLKWLRTKLSQRVFENREAWKDACAVQNIRDNAACYDGHLLNQ